MTRRGTRSRDGGRAVGGTRLKFGFTGTVPTVGRTTPGRTTGLSDPWALTERPVSVVHTSGAGKGRVSSGTEHGWHF